MSAWSKRISRYCFMALAAPMILSLPAHAQNQQQPPPQAQPQPEQQPLSQQQLQQLVAPIALYPDALLAQVLTASTYPLEVTLAARWAEKNANVKGPALEAAMQKEPWDPSVKGLTAVPQVLAMMNEKLDWTAQLGEAFLAQPNDVQTAVQTLRKQAETTGNLKSGKEQKVSRMPAPQGTGYAGPPEYIVIEPLEPDYVYVPVYDPVVIYGPGYWTPAYTPFFWRPSWWVAGPVIAFGAAAFVGPALWYRYNWGHPGFAAIQTNPVLYSKFNKVAVAPGAGPGLEVQRGESRRAVQEHEPPEAVRQCWHEKSPGRPDLARTANRHTARQRRAGRAGSPGRQKRSGTQDEQHHPYPEQQDNSDQQDIRATRPSRATRPFRRTRTFKATASRACGRRAVSRPSIPAGATRVLGTRMQARSRNTPDRAAVTGRKLEA